MSLNSIDGTQHMPSPADEITIKLAHLRKPHTPETWLRFAAELNTDYQQSKQED